MDITKPAITRLARRAGVKSISEDCFPAIRAVLVQQLQTVMDAVHVVNSEHQTKTIMISDVYNALSILGINMTQSHDIGTTTLTK